MQALLGIDHREKSSDNYLIQHYRRSLKNRLNVIRVHCNNPTKQKSMHLLLAL